MDKKFKRWLYVAILFTGCGIFVSQIILSDIIGLVFQYDFRFLSASLALLGLGAGGIFASVFFEKIRLNFSKSFSLAGFFYTATIVLPFLFTRGIPPVEDKAVLILIFLASFLNFFFGGLIISLIFASENKSIFKLYFFDLVGAAIGGIIIIFLTDFLGLYSAIYFLFVVGSGVFFSCWLSGHSFKVNKKTILVVAFLAAIILIITKISFHVECSSSSAGFIKEQSNSFSHLYLYEVEKTEGYFKFNILINCNIFTSGFITKNIENIREKVDDFRFAIFKIADYKKVLIVGSGAGVDISRALLAGSEKITAVEINKLIIGFSNSFAENLGKSPYQNEKVKTIVSEARTYLSQEKEKYDLLLIAHAKNFGKPLGIQLFIPKNLYTLEAFSEYLNKLEPGGTLAIADWTWFTRQYLKTLASLAAQNWLDPEKHLIVLTNSSFREPTELIIFQKDGISFEKREKIKSLAGQYNFIYHGNPVKELPLNNIKIITDDKPFLWQSQNIAIYPPYLIPTASLLKDFMIIILSSVAILVIAILAFLLKTKNKIKNIGAPIFFVGISLGLAGLEFVLVNKITLLLGNPAYSHIIALSSILLFGGLGSLFAANKRVHQNVQKMLFIMSLIIIIGYFSIDNIIKTILPLDYSLKILSIISLIFIPSFLSGIFFPIALKKVGERNNALVPWLWGIDALAFVIASLAISFLVLFYGVKIILIFSFFGYILAAATVGDFEKI